MSILSVETEEEHDILIQHNCIVGLFTKAQLPRSCNNLQIPHTAFQPDEVSMVSMETAKCALPREWNNYITKQWLELTNEPIILLAQFEAFRLLCVPTQMLKQCANNTE